MTGGGVGFLSGDVVAERRERLRLPPVDVDRIVEARIVEVVMQQVRSVDLLISRDVAAAVRSVRRGRASGTLESIVIQLAAQEVVPLLSTNRLTTADARAAGRAASTRIASLDDHAGGAGRLELRRPGQTLRN